MASSQVCSCSHSPYTRPSPFHPVQNPAPFPTSVRHANSSTLLSRRASITAASPETPNVCPRQRHSTRKARTLRWELRKDLGHAAGWRNLAEGTGAEWSTAATRSKGRSWVRARGVLPERIGNTEEDPIGEVPKAAVRDVDIIDVSDFEIRRAGDAETDVGWAEDSVNGRRLGAGEAERADFYGEAENAHVWGEGEELQNRQPSPSTAIDGTAEGVEKEGMQRFRVRNGREVFEERAYVVGVDKKGPGGRALFHVKDSLDELSQLADTAGLAVVGSTYQKLENPNPKTYIGGGKVADLKAAIQAFKVETVIFDDELSPGQARNLEKVFGDNVRVCDRTALILDIFSQRAATREATLQVELARFEYQLPRLTKMWTHLERQAGGLVKGMGEKQIEVDKRILRTRIAGLRKDLESVREHRQQYRDRRAAVPIPVISLVGYTNAGKSTFLNRLSGANVLAEDKLFATLDPTTRRVELPNGKECLFTDTVGFIQKLPTQLVAAFRATLEEITDSSLMLHMVDISHPMAKQQIQAVEGVLAELDVNHIPMLTVWNKVDKARDSDQLRSEASKRDNVICISALTGEGMDDVYDAIERKIKDLMVSVEVVVPYGKGDLVNIIHRLGIVDLEEYTEAGTLMRAYVPLSLSRKLLPLRQACA